jgi:PhoPQ-activated pathogenicity-related protein
LPGNNQIYFAPNTDHGLASGTLARLDEGTVNSFFAWYIGFVRGATRPSLTYQYLDDETVVITTDRAPSSITLWQATNQTARDFRLQTFGPNWKSTPVTGGVNNRYVVSVDTPDQGWTAWMVQATFPGPDPALDLPYGLSSPVRVTPDLYPDEID